MESKALQCILKGGDKCMFPKTCKSLEVNSPLYREVMRELRIWLKCRYHNFIIPTVKNRK
jgi:hypothetical protein